MSATKNRGDVIMPRSNIADEIDREFKKKKAYANRNKSKTKDNEFLEKMVEAFVEEMRND